MELNNECYKSHPPLSVVIENKKFNIYGGSCHNPIEDAELYVSLDEGAKVFDWEYPWNKNEFKKQHIRLFIKDMFIPENMELLKKTLDYVIENLKENKKIHVGCTAGHGRTGLFLAALIQQTMKNELKENKTNAIDYVRSNYCNKAVETTAQIIYLKHGFNADVPEEEKDDVINFEKMFLNLTESSIKNALKKYKIDDLCDAIGEVEHEIYKMEYRVLDKNFFTQKPSM